MAFALKKLKSVFSVVLSVRSYSNGALCRAIFAAVCIFFLTFIS